MKLSKIEKQFENKGIVRGGLLLLKPLDAINLVKLCQKKNVNILGIDAFEIKNSRTQPVQEHSVDFTLMNIKEKSSYFLEAFDFLEEHLKTDFYFGLVLEIHS